MSRVFLVEDEVSLNNLLVSYLIDAGYEVTSFINGLDAKVNIVKNPDLWILDIMLPGLDGYSLIKEIKSVYPDTPVVFMSARNAELDRVLGLEMGSDDYLPKPFLPRELVLRVNRLLKTRPEILPLNSIDIGSYTFNRKKRVILFENSEISLSVKEFSLLEYLVENMDNAKSRTEILDNIWGENYFGSDRVVDDTLRRIKKKCPKLSIENLYGFGYILKWTDE